MHSSPEAGFSTDKRAMPRKSGMKGSLDNLRRFKVFMQLTAIVIAMAVLPFSFCLAENLLANTDFLDTDEEGLPVFWYTDAYISEPGYTVFKVETDPETGLNMAEIRNIGSNDARYAQLVEVEPDSLYRLSADVLAEGVTGGHGANLSIEGIYAFSRKLYDTEGEWQHIDYYGETGPDQEYVTVFARLGGYSGESTGRACFRNIRLEKVDNVPGELVADLWFRDTDNNTEDEDEDETGESGPAWPWLLVISAVYAAAASALIRYLTNNHRIRFNTVERPHTTVSGAFLIIAFSLVIRIFLSVNTEGYMVDVNCFLSWGQTFASVGPAGFYEATNFCDYPPLYTYVLGLNSLVSGALGSGDAVTRIVFRLIPTACDLWACCILYRLLLNRNVIRGNDALIYLALLAFNPAAILNSAAWGQMDSVLCLLLMCVALLAVDGKWILSLPLYVVSVLVKPQALMLGPLGLCFIIKSFISDRESRRPILAGTAFSFVVLAAGVIPFSIRQSPDWLIRLYAGTLGSYPYATVNTANLYYLLGGNWSKVEALAHPSAPVLLGLFSAGYGGYWWFRAGQLKFRTIESAAALVFAAAFLTMAVLGASWAWVGGTAMLLAFVIVLSMAVRGKKTEILCYLGALLFILLYVFGVKMHERYLFPALLLLAAAWVKTGDRRILNVFILFTTTLFINEGIVLDNSIRLGSSMGHLNSDTVWLADFLSVLNVLGSAYAVHLGTELLHEKHPKPAPAFGPLFPVRKTVNPENSPTNELRTDRSLHWKLKDTLILSAITAVYAAVSLLTLGSAKAPQTEWKASSDEEQVIFDLGKHYDRFSILYFAQVSREDFSFAVSDDGELWSEEQWAQMDQGQCWKWKYVTESYPGGESGRTYYNSDLDHVIHMSGRYVRLSAHNLGLTLNEIIFRDSEGKNIPVTISSRIGEIPESELFSDPENLKDEQDTMEKLPAYFGDAQYMNTPAQPCWWNSTYFDEIYHARTAFEFLKGSVPYETSHPPLGKVLMSACVAVFGMTPFGWRFAGAVAGILMLPGMYLLGKQLTKKTGIAVIACLLMAFDCMHLTQTQIATIDSFPVLFIIFAYFFMLRFLQTDIFRHRISRILPDLAASGLFMGLSIASKWIGIYAGAGLAILFFWHCFRTMRADRRSRVVLIQQEQNEGDEPDIGRLSTSTETGLHREKAGRILAICFWCVLFFVVIPIVIYLLSYVPYLSYNSRRIKSFGDYFSAVWRSQESMFSYHSTKNLGMDHPFYSPWWEWPVIGKPMYYAAEQYLPAGTQMHYTIFSFGNPVVWFGGLAALVFCAWRAAVARRYTIPGESGIWHLWPVTHDPRYMFVFTGILAQYLPWVLVPRGTYIYHYFASLPFLMLAISLCFDGWEGKSMKTAKAAGGLFVLIAAAAFAVLFPYASGICVPASWLDLIKIHAGTNAADAGILRIWY